tara:strand:+ start:35 stop:373 length:339 start_codon:yes stop_codon:yes gene_type:complete
MKKELILIEYDKTIQEAMEKIIFNKTRTIFVSKNYKVIGTISEGDILRSLYDKKNLQTPLINIINKNFKYLDEKNSSILEAKKLFKKFSVLIIPVLDKKGRLKSLYHINDIL